MELSNKAAYIKGLMEGMKIDESTDQGKVLKAMAELMEEMAKAIEDVTVLADETVDVVDSLSDDLSDLEDDFYEEYYDDEDDDDDVFDDDTLYECVCPSCGETIVMDDKMVENGSIECPNCGESLEFDFSDDDTEE
ncbi:MULTISPECIES: CD1247 N-terminal domain-containing protein [Ruminococcus]|jgi:formylmethanofuran dehydrogenase subunit E|uniref:TFIIB-type domain-containing protein n=1 Tax=Ruminococcus albus 8 TaxID=246199 RepID=E9SDE9_RUMAL|nr:MULTISPECIES: CD1247 N-terminal domain-containing protein [Ruminococcus]MBE6874042.1 hypothetical protein [Ruminococcus albus]EGC02552.1 hypothetical protein CUS_7134 [Ruminococcus albus 8]MBO5557446.1 hypothetical protein [Ruminococcus sp.]MBQ9541353.1 hypothetical protein [Ruminococcus sp.]MBR0529634.1 hypothetical protein [Ruminococcus sp.]